VLDAAYKVWHEIDRLRGLLRFCPDEDGVYIARCAPDHFVLPALGQHFRERFGETPWAVIDEKRSLYLHCAGGGEPELFCMGDGCSFAGNTAGGEWENLWRHYHKTINNESRNNPDLQRRFMPKRYWKYLTEL
jgi:probable DNA metabolism protein